MAQRKTVGLRSFFARYLLLAVAGTMAIIVAGIALFFGAMSIGVVYPASIGETTAQAYMKETADTGVFRLDEDSGLFDYVLFDASGAVESSSLSDSALSRTVARYADQSAFYSAAGYVPLNDGKTVLFTWDYAVPFVNPALRAVFPDATLVFGATVLVCLVVFYALFVRAVSRKLSSRLDLVETASKQIAAQDLENPLATSTGIREFDHALLSMDGMRQALKESLTKQWESDQQRKDEIAALAHDVKTPLTIINGNAELLLERPLDRDQRGLAESILSAGKRAGQYVAALQQVSRLDSADKDAEEIEIERLMQDVSAALRPLAQVKGVSLSVDCGNDLHTLRGYLFSLTCALVNIGENAVRFTPEGGCVSVAVEQRSCETTFTFDDGGPGFSAEAIKHAHEMFWQQDESRSDRQHCGMGLAIAAKVAAQHGGVVEFENASEGGRVRLTVRNDIVLHG